MFDARPLAPAVRQQFLDVLAFGARPEICIAQVDFGGGAVFGRVVRGIRKTIAQHGRNEGHVTFVGHLGDVFVLFGGRLGLFWQKRVGIVGHLSVHVLQQRSYDGSPDIRIEHLMPLIGSLRK